MQRKQPLRWLNVGKKIHDEYNKSIYGKNQITQNTSGKIDTFTSGQQTGNISSEFMTPEEIKFHEISIFLPFINKTHALISFRVGIKKKNKNKNGS